MGDEGSSLSRDDNERILASLTGGEAPIGMKNVNVDADESSAILLTFTGGGHSVEFSFTSDEGLDDSSYGIEMEVSGGFELGNWLEAETTVRPWSRRTSSRANTKMPFHAVSVTNARLHGTKEDTSCPNTFSATQSLVTNSC